MNRRLAAAGICVSIGCAALGSPKFAFVDLGLGAQVGGIFHVNDLGDFAGAVNGLNNAFFRADVGGYYWFVNDPAATTFGLNNNRFAILNNLSSGVSRVFDLGQLQLQTFTYGRPRLLNNLNQAVVFTSDPKLLDLGGNNFGTYDIDLFLSTKLNPTYADRVARNNLNSFGEVVAVSQSGSAPGYIYSPGGRSTIPWDQISSASGSTLSSGFVNDWHVAAGLCVKGSGASKTRTAWYLKDGLLTQIAGGAIDVCGIDNTGTVFGADGYELLNTFTPQSAWMFDTVGGKRNLQDEVVMPNDGYNRTITNVEAVSSGGTVAVRYSFNSQYATSGLLFPIEKTAHVVGHLQSEDFGSNWSQFLVSVMVYRDGQFVAWRVPRASAGGEFSWYEPLEGNLQFLVSTKHSLKKAVPPIAVSNMGHYDFSVNLIGGDIDRDNSVSVFDYLILSDAFDSTSTDTNWLIKMGNGYYPRDADLDFDGAVTIFDYLIINKNFDMFGD
ncbi:MAG: hypothetical protein JST40_07695 [Armatimonadetes bacterium]|nr:hypothetical protein [Armatimonadota bacterium]